MRLVWLFSCETARQLSKSVITDCWSSIAAYHICLKYTIYISLERSGKAVAAQELCTYAYTTLNFSELKLKKVETEITWRHNVLWRSRGVCIDAENWFRNNFWYLKLACLRKSSISTLLAINNSPFWSFQKIH